MAKENTKNTTGITVRKSEDISSWYTEVIIKSDLVDYSDVSGCMIFKPYGYAIWEVLQREVDKRFKADGIQNAYFPLFIPEKHLSREQEHVEGFSPEVAWVTHTGSTELAERLAIRPTSETIIYPSYSRWIRSWRDLPLRLNLWNNVVRWEFKNPVPLLRSREFLWQEGHTVYATKEEAEAEGPVILGIYNEVLRDFLAIYGVKGYKSEKEKFAGAEYTCSIESFLESGKAIQGPDFHHDGQKFAKAFDIQFLDKDEKKQYAFQNTYAFTTRMIGVMVMMHGDDRGLVLPPFVAPVQIVIVPIYKNDNREMVLAESEKVKELLSEYRVKIDDREEYSPGWKFNEWELKGVPIRIEIGPRDISKRQVVLAVRDQKEKSAVSMDSLNDAVNNSLCAMHKRLYDRSKENFESSIVEVEDMRGLSDAVRNKKMAYAPFCNEPGCEDEIKAALEGVTTRCSPLDSEVPKDKRCVFCKKPAKRMFYFARAY